MGLSIMLSAWCSHSFRRSKERFLGGAAKMSWINDSCFFIHSKKKETHTHRVTVQASESVSVTVCVLPNPSPRLNVPKKKKETTKKALDFSHGADVFVSADTITYCCPSSFSSDWEKVM